MSGKKKRKYLRKPKPAEPNLILSDIFYTSQQVADMFHISMRCLKYWRDNCILPFFKLANGKVLFNKTDVDELVNRNRRFGLG